jgi:thioredoxin-related protein
MSGRSLSFAVAVLGLVGSALAQEGQWLQNFEDAKAKAKADGKDLLVDFTGSDWCVWCKRLDAEVFAEKAFQDGVAKGYVLVKLDFPKDENLVTEAIKKQNAQLQSDYKIQGFPTILLMDPAGRPYAQTGYQQGGAAPYLEHLAGLQKAKAARDEHFGKAKGAEGAERAKHLAAGLDAMAEEVVMQHYKAEVDEVMKLDADGKAGLKAKYEAKLAMVELEEKFQELAQNGDWDAVDKYMAELLTKYKGNVDIEQKATFYRAVVLIEDKHDFAGALKGIDAARAIAPDSEFGKRLEQIRKNVERIQKQQEEQDGKDKKDDKKDGGH